MNIRELAKEWDVDPAPLIAALGAAQRERRYWQGQRPLIASAEPAVANRRLRQAHKAVAALPLRASASLHWELAERIAYGLGLDPGQVRQLMCSMDLTGLVLDALNVQVEPRSVEDPTLQRLARAWTQAGGRVSTEDFDGRYDPYFIEFLGAAFLSLGDTVSDDAIRLRLDRLDP